LIYRKSKSLDPSAAIPGTFGLPLGPEVAKAVRQGFSGGDAESGEA